MAYRILYVEDARPFQRILQKMLEDLAEVAIASTIEQGWEMLCRESYQLVICDFMFPEGDAFPLLFKIRKTHTPVQLPVIMLTSAADKVTISKFFDVGVNVSVRKPPEAVSFRELVFKMLRQPWVDQPQHVTGDVQLLSWSTAAHAFVYCPNLGIQTKGATKAEAVRLMHEQIRQLIEKGATWPTISDPKLSTFFPVALSPAAEAAAPAVS